MDAFSLTGLLCPPNARAQVGHRGKTGKINLSRVTLPLRGVHRVCLCATAVVMCLSWHAVRFSCPVVHKMYRIVEHKQYHRCGNMGDVRGRRLVSHVGARPVGSTDTYCDNGKCNEVDEGGGGHVGEYVTLHIRFSHRVLSVHVPALRLGDGGSPLLKLCDSRERRLDALLELRLKSTKK